MSFIGLIAISLTFGFVKVGSPIPHVLVQDPVQSNCNWSVVIARGEDVSKQSRK